MQSHVSKRSARLNKTIATHATRKRTDGEAASRIADNRPEAAQIARIQLMAGGSPKTVTAVQLQTMIDSSPRMIAQRKQMDRMFSNTTQLFENPEEELQMKAGPTTTTQLAGITEDELQMKAVPTTTIQLAGMTEDELQMKAVPGTVQREPELDEELPAQGKSIGNAAPRQLQPNPNPKANKTGLPYNVKAGVENLSGVSLDNVNVHFNSAKPAQLNALAYTQGTDIHVGPGQEKHLPHEAWHVVQQNQGRVKPTTQMVGTQVNDDVRLEREADLMGAKSLSGRSEVFNSVQRKERDTVGNRVVQAMNIRGDYKASEVSGITHNKHVVAVADQPAAAQANYGSTTFVTTDAALTGVVDGDAHNFTDLNGAASGRWDINANVPIYQYDKTGVPPPGLAKTQPVVNTVDNVSTSCEIGAKKGGDEKIKITHFKSI